MDPQFRPAFNRAYTPELYRAFLQRLETALGPVPFRVAETPLFVTPALRTQLARQAVEIVQQLAEPAKLERLKRAIPAKYDTPGMDALPNCVQVDFAMTPGPDGTLEGKVVELQAFPSGYAMMTFFADAWRETFAQVPGLQTNWSCFVDMTPEQGYDLMRRTIVGGEDPEHVALVDFEPEHQKTAVDFVATQRLFGVETACATKLIKKGRSLFRESRGLLVPVRRIYNRMVFDELEVKGYALPWDWRDDLDVTWASHPNWYWVWSKYSLPFLDHPAVPKARFVSDLTHLPDDLSGFVLKPLFSFAGSGVVIDVTPEDIARIPEAQRGGWVLQDKITYASAITAPGDVQIKAEVRVMLLRAPEDEALRPVIFLARMSRGKMLGVDQNKGMTWVGGSVSIWPGL